MGDVRAEIVLAMYILHERPLFRPLFSPIPAFYSVRFWLRDMLPQRLQISIYFG